VFLELWTGLLIATAAATTSTAQHGSTQERDPIRVAVARKGKHKHNRANKNQVEKGDEEPAKNQNEKKNTHTHTNTSPSVTSKLTSRLYPRKVMCRFKQGVVSMQSESEGGNGMQIRLGWGGEQSRGGARHVKLRTNACDPTFEDTRVPPPQPCKS
jgi:hypothetical protein